MEEEASLKVKYFNFVAHKLSVTSENLVSLHTIALEIKPLHM